MLTFTYEEFAARRRGAQERAIAALEPAVEEALRNYDARSDWWRSLLTPIHDLFNEVLATDSGGDVRSDPLQFARLAHRITDALPKTGPPGPTTAETLAAWLTTATINAAAQSAAMRDPEPLLLAWVTMHDDKVRATHRAIDGQERPPGEAYDLGDGVQLMYPGDPRGPIEDWINCRCMLRPLLAEHAASTTEPVLFRQGGDMSTETVKPEAKDIGLTEPLTWHGVLAPEGVFSGDGRQFKQGSLRNRDLPLPLTWQKVSADGHDSAYTVAKITNIARVGDEMRATGTWLDSAETDEVVGLLAEFGKFGVSVDADDSTFDFDPDTGEMTFSDARICSACIVNIPAFAEAFVAMGSGPDDFMPGPMDCDPSAPDYEDCMAKQADAKAAAAEVEEMGRGPGWLTNPEDTKRIHDYWTVPGEPGYIKIGWGLDGDFNRCKVEVGQEIAENSPEKVRFLNQICSQWHHDATGFWPGHAPAERGHALRQPEGEMAPAVSLVASSRPQFAKASWFADPKFTKPTPVRVTADGRVFGHLFGWQSCHAAYPGTCVAPPHSMTGYAHFLTGAVLTDAGEVPVGHITMGGEHAPQRLGLPSAMAFYDSTSTVVADVACGEDEHGLWLSGRVRPGASAEDIEALRASALSGDWREDYSTGNLELIVAHGVNSPGFLIPRVGMQDGHQVSLVAAGMVRAEPDVLTESAITLIADKVVAAIGAKAKRRERMAALAARVKDD